MMTKILGLLAGLAIAAVFWLVIQADNDRQRIEALEAQVGQLQQSVATPCKPRQPSKPRQR